MKTIYRTLNSEIILSEEYRKLPASSQSLYIICMMEADEFGFINDVYKLCCNYGFDMDNVTSAVNRGFLILFPDSSALIAHWFLHTGTLIQFDTERADFYSLIKLDEDGVFREHDNMKKTRKKTAFIPPTLEEVKEYAKSRNSCVDPVAFYTYFNSPNERGETWVDSNGKKVLNWKGKFVTWEKMRNMRRNEVGRSNQKYTNASSKGDSSGSSKWRASYTVDGTAEG